MKKINKIFVLAAAALLSLWLTGCSPDAEVKTEGAVFEASVSETDRIYVNYYFRNTKLLNQHFEKHGKDMGFDTPESYEKAASNVINDERALSKTEKEDGDFVYYIEETNEFVVLSTDGYIRTYFCPDSGKKYFDKQ